MKEIKISDVMDSLILYAWSGITIFAAFTLIIMFSFFLVDPNKFGFQLAIIAPLCGMIWCGWMLKKYKDIEPEFKVDRYLWLGISCFLIYLCLQLINSGLWLWIPAIACIIFYSLFVKDAIKTILDWKRNVKITWH